MLLLLLLLLLTKYQVVSKRMGSFKKDLRLKIKSRDHLLFPFSVLFWPKFLNHMILLLRVSTAECGVRWNRRWVKLESVMRVSREVCYYGRRLGERLGAIFSLLENNTCEFSSIYSSSILNECEMDIYFQRHKNLVFFFQSSVVFW